MRRRVAALAVALLTIAPATAAGAETDTLEPSRWPPELALGSAPNALRYGGADRYQTSLAMSLALRGAGGFPFDTADRTGGGADSLASSSHWWGAATCPSSVIVVAGDTAADALAAAPLSDPTNRSNEPRLERVAAADPLFDPIGGFDRVDTFAAPVVVTASGRSGARGLSTPARVAVSDLRFGGCATAREAVIVGGTAAVPAAVERELVSLGYQEVFRVAGTDRFDTAARIATALGTEVAPAGGVCEDERVDDGLAEMGFYGNAVIEYRPDASTCQLQGRTVVLAEGRIGADALAAGWWMSFWQVPVLLVEGDGSLPAATRGALQSMAIDTIVVLGGTGRIPEATVEEAGRLAGAVVGRFAGFDRYGTAILMATVFGGWYQTGDADDFASDRICLAASTGASMGWPDALAAGPLCARMAATSETQTAPARALEPVPRGAMVDPGRPAHDAVPVLLVPAGAESPTAALGDALAGWFPPDGQWCGSLAAIGCRVPGFVAAFGGPAAVADGVLADLSAAVAGGDAAQRGETPTLEVPFATRLDLAPVYRGDVAAGAPRSCVDRGALRSIRWLAVYDDAAMTEFGSMVDALDGELYAEDGTSHARCAETPAVGTTLVGVSASGRWAAGRPVSGDADRSISMSDWMRHGGPLLTRGEPGTSAAPDTGTEWRYRDSPGGVLELREGRSSRVIHEVSARIFLQRDATGSAGRFTADLVIDDGVDPVVATAAGDAVLTGGRWELAGRVLLPGATGGFRATLELAGTPTNDDDVLTWRLDGARI